LNNTAGRATPSGNVAGLQARLPGKPLNDQTISDPVSTAAILCALEDEVANRHALGHFLVDALLKLRIGRRIADVFPQRDS
jgi:hypothetical protein